VAGFRARAADAGPLAGAPAPRRRMDVAFCEVLHYDPEGRVESGELYYDAMSALMHLGHLRPPASAAV
jgi:hypothetical protein